MITYQTKIKLHETDAAGVLFFVNQLKIVHDAFEVLLESIGFAVAGLINEKDFLLPIVHSESDYKLPLSVGDPVEVQTVVADLGETSFTIAYTLLDAAQNIAGTALTVHVAVDKATYAKIPLPAELRKRLQSL